MTQIVHYALQKPGEAFGYVIMGMFMLALIIRFGKQLVREIINDED